MVFQKMTQFKWIKNLPKRKRPWQEALMDATLFAAAGIVGPMKERHIHTKADLLRDAGAAFPEIMEMTASDYRKRAAAQSITGS